MDDQATNYAQLEDSKGLVEKTCNTSIFQDGVLRARKQRGQANLWATIVFIVPWFFLNPNISKRVCSYLAFVDELIIHYVIVIGLQNRPKFFSVIACCTPP